MAAFTPGTPSLPTTDPAQRSEPLLDPSGLRAPPFPKGPVELARIRGRKVCDGQDPSRRSDLEGSVELSRLSHQHLETSHGVGDPSREPVQIASRVLDPDHVRKL